MKNKIFIFVLFIGIFIFNSCSKDEPENEGLPYYQFSIDETNKLINKPNVADEIIYKNQDNELIKFKVYSSEKGKTTYKTGSFAGGYSNAHFHYDRQQIKMWYAEGHLLSNCEINIQKYPVGSNYQISPIVVGIPKFYGYFNFPLWNGYYGTDIYNNNISIDFLQPTVTISFNGKTYTKVRIFESNRTEILSPTNTLPFYPRNVHKIFYDDNFGIIGFDDLNGKLWRLQ